MTLETEIISKLKVRAEKASKNAYAPYSKFRVGSAVMDHEGNIFVGCNVENASYGLTQCAERNAINAAIANGSAPGSLQTLVIFLPGDRALPPCGACRQVMHEMMAEDSHVIACCEGDEVKSWTRSEYLPDPFDFKQQF